MPNHQDFITVRQAADLIGVSPATLLNWDRAGKLKVVRSPMNRYRLSPKAETLVLPARLRTRPTGEAQG